MKHAWRRVLLVLVCCALAVAGWIGLLNLAASISAVRAYRASPAELRAAADAAVLPAAAPAFSGSEDYTDAEQAEAQSEYYASIGGDPLDVEPLEPIIGKFVSYIPGMLPAEAPQISASTSENVQTFIVNTSSGYFILQAATTSARWTTQTAAATPAPAPRLRLCIRRVRIVIRRRGYGKTQINYSRIQLESRAWHYVCKAEDCPRYRNSDHEAGPQAKAAEFSLDGCCVWDCGFRVQPSISPAACSGSCS